MSTLLLHIGYPKTGTSYLQSALAGNRSLLRRSWLDYLDPAAEGIFEQPERSMQHEYLARKLKFQSSEESTGNWRRVIEWVAASRCRYCMISSETCSMLSKPAVRALGGFLSAVYVTVLVWLRPQPDAIASRCLQALSSGCPVGSYQGYLEQSIRSRQYHYTEVLSNWEVFGRENLRVRVYDRSKMKKGSILDEFLDQFGVVPAAPLRLSSVDANPSVGPRAHRLLLQLTEWTSSSTKGVQATARCAGTQSFQGLRNAATRA